MEDEMVVPYTRLRRKEKCLQELNDKPWRKINTYNKIWAWDMRITLNCTSTYRPAVP
jgi:hypothetical protein